MIKDEPGSIDREDDRFRLLVDAITDYAVYMLDRGDVEMAEAQLQIEHYWAGALRRAVIDGDVETGSVMAGQSVGMVKEEQSVAEILKQLVDEAAYALERRSVHA